MIQVNELRIGNWLLYSDGFDKKMVQVDSEIMFEACCLNKDFNRTKKPIPLTPEILEKCGFGRNDNYYSNGKMEFKVESLRIGMDVYMVPNALYCSSIQYLHQLQNLFFALTGEELAFNP